MSSTSESAGPDPTAAALAAAFEFHRAGRRAEAEALYRQVLTVQPGHADAWAWLGVLAYQDGQAEPALAHLGRAVTLAPQRADLRQTFGRVLHAMGLAAEAAAQYQEALATRPDLADAHAGLACLAAGQGPHALPEGCRLGVVGPHLLLLPPGHDLPDRSARPGYGTGIAILVRALLSVDPGLRIADLAAGIGETVALLEADHRIPLTAFEDDPAQRLYLAYNAGRIGAHVTVEGSGRLNQALGAGLVRLSGPGQLPRLAAGGLGSGAVLWGHGLPDAAGLRVLQALGIRQLLLIGTDGRLKLETNPASQPSLPSALGDVDFCAIPPRHEAMMPDLVGRFASGADAISWSPRAGGGRIGVGGRALNPPLPDPRTTRRILVVRLDRLGDFLLTTPLLRHLRARCPHAHITLAVQPMTYALAETCPYVDQLMTVPEAMLASPIGMLELAGRARRELPPFDLALLPRWDIDYYQAGLLAWAVQPRSVLGFSEQVRADKRKLNAGYDRLYTVVLDDRTPGHEVERSLHLLGLVTGNALGAPAERIEPGPLEAWLRPEDQAHADALLVAAGLPAGTFIALGTGASIGRRRWPLDRWAQLVRLLAAAGHRAAIVGGPGEVQEGAWLAAAVGPAVVNLAGRTTPRQTVALLARAGLHVGCDSFPLHAAAAAGRPVVEIACHPADGDRLHDNSPLRFGPWGVPHRICQPATAAEGCTKSCTAVEQPHCILGVGVDMVARAIAELLGELAARRG